MFDEREPLMFINSINTKIENNTKSNNQQIFDSRKNKKSDLCFKVEERKIKNIIEMYRKKRPVFCEISTFSDTIKGIPYMLIDNILKVYIAEGIEEEIDINKIPNISIIRF